MTTIWRKPYIHEAHKDMVWCGTLSTKRMSYDQCYRFVSLWTWLFFDSLNSGIRPCFTNIKIECSLSSRYYCTCSQLRPTQIESNTERSQSLLQEDLHCWNFFHMYSRKREFPKNTSGNPRSTILSDPFILCASTTKLRVNFDIYGDPDLCLTLC